MQVLVNLFPVIAFGAVFLYVGYFVWQRGSAIRDEQARTGAGERIATTVGLGCLGIAALLTLWSMGTAQFSAGGTAAISLFALGFAVSLGARILLTARRRSRERGA
jgi:nicotinamide riboside transporter PnuC